MRTDGGSPFYEGANLTSAGRASCINGRGGRPGDFGVWADRSSCATIEVVLQDRQRCDDRALAGECRLDGDVIVFKHFDLLKRRAPQQEDLRPEDIITGITGAPGQKPAGADDGAKPKPKPKKPGDRGADVSPTPLDGLEDLTGGVLIGAVACARGRVQDERRATGMWTCDPRGIGVKRAPRKDALTYDSRAGALKSASR